MTSMIMNKAYNNTASFNWIVEKRMQRIQKQRHEHLLIEHNKKTR
jgi:hypothetical protein